MALFACMIIQRYLSEKVQWRSGSAPKAGYFKNWVQNK